MAVDFSRFDSLYDTEELAKNVGVKEKDGSFDNGSYEKIPHGTYEVKIDKCELKASKKDEPMVSIWFKIINGNYKNNLIFMNQVITKDFQIHLVNLLLRSLDTGLDIKFESYNQYAQLLLDVAEKVDIQKLEFALEYGENNKGYDTFTINEVFESDNPL